MNKFLTPLIMMLAGVSLHAQTFQHMDPLSFTMPFAGANPLPQVLNISSTGADFSFTATATTSTGGSWLSVSPSGFCCTTPYNFQVIVTVPVGGLSAGTYNGQVEFSTASTSLTVSVTLVVAGLSGTFFDNMPGGLSFTGKPGTPTFASQILQVRNGGPGTLNWNLTKTTFNSANWLTVSATSGTAPSFVTVGITTANLPNAGLTAGVFTGTLTFQEANSSVTVPISVTIGTTVFEQINGLGFTKPFAGANPLAQVLQVASTGTAMSFTAVAVSGTGGNWLSVSPSGFCCTTPSIHSVSVNPNIILAAGTYTAQVLITTGTLAIVIPVNLTIAAPATSFLDNMPGQLSFTVKTAGPNPPAQLVQVRNGGTGTLNWTLVSSTYDNGAWLNVTPVLGTAPGFVSVQIVVANLPNAGLVAGQFSGQLLFQAPGSNVTVPISVVVGASVFEQVNGITFVKPLNGANPLPQVLTMASTGSAFSFTATAISATGGDWLAVSPSGFCCTVPSILTVSANPDITLAAGIYTGEVVVTSGAQAVTVPVTLIIGAPGTPFFDNLPGQLSYSMKTAGPNPTAQLVQIRNGGTGTLNWTATAATSDSGNWLTLSATSGTAPSNVTIGINAANLPSQGLVAGLFTGTVLFQSGNNTATIPISVAVGGNSFAQINPISFTMISGGANPLPQILTVTSIGSAFSMTTTAATATGGNWLTVTPSGFCCTTPTVFTVSVNALVTLGAGTYTGQVEITSGSRAITVPVTLTVAAPNAAVFDNVQGGMTFYSAVGGAGLASQTIQLRNAGQGTLNWTAAANTFDDGNWLTVSSPSGAAPSTITIGVITGNLPNQGLVAGVATGQILFQSSAGNITVPVSVQLGANVFVQRAALSFSKNFGAGSPLAQTVTVSSGGTNFSYTASASAGNGGNWLSVSPSGFCCTTQQVNTATVTAPAAFPAGIYTGQLLFNQGGMAMVVPVMLTVAGQAALSISKTHTGDFSQGQNAATYSVTASNGISAAATNGTVTVTEAVPAGLTLMSMAGTGWNCGANSCTRSDALVGGASYPPITVTVNVAANATSPQVNQVTVSGGGSSSANANDSTIVQPGVSHPAFFTGEVALSNGIYYLQFPSANLFGYYSYVTSSIIFHFDMGYEYVSPSTGSTAYLYDFASGHWFYTNPSLFPDLYDFTLNAWIYYFPDTTNAGHYTTNPRYFVNLGTGTIFTM